MAVNGDGQHLLGVFLADDVFVQVRENLARRGNSVEKLLARTAAAFFLVEDRLAQLDALAADVDVARTFYQGADVSIALSAK
jgi:hypothetical protein